LNHVRRQAAGPMQSQEFGKAAEFISPRRASGAVNLAVGCNPRRHGIFFPVASGTIEFNPRSRDAGMFYNRPVG